MNNHLMMVMVCALTASLIGNNLTAQEEIIQFKKAAKVSKQAAHKLGKKGARKRSRVNRKGVQLGSQALFRIAQTSVRKIKNNAAREALVTLVQAGVDMSYSADRVYADVMRIVVGKQAVSQKTAKIKSPAQHSMYTRFARRCERSSAKIVDNAATVGLNDTVQAIGGLWDSVMGAYRPVSTLFANKRKALLKLSDSIEKIRSINQALAQVRASIMKIDDVVLRSAIDDCARIMCTMLIRLDQTISMANRRPPLTLSCQVLLFHKKAGKKAAAKRSIKAGQKKPLVVEKNLEDDESLEGDTSSRQMDIPDDSSDNDMAEELEKAGLSDMELGEEDI